MIKKSLVIISLSLILVLSISLVSAGLFGNLFQKKVNYVADITGEAVAPSEPELGEESGVGGGIIKSMCGGGDQFVARGKCGDGDTCDMCLTPGGGVYVVNLKSSAPGGTSKTSAELTPYYDRDNMDGSGDYETINDLIKEGKDVCTGKEIIGIQCQTTEGVDYSETGEIYTCNTDVGGVCINKNQPDGKCNDYQVRFFCGEEKDSCSGTITKSCAGTNTYTCSSYSGKSPCNAYTPWRFYCKDPNWDGNCIQKDCSEVPVANCESAGCTLTEECVEEGTAESCTETDGGQEYGVVGGVSGYDSSGNFYSFTDSCSSTDILQEYFCSGNSYSQLSITCREGCDEGICSGGECVEEEESEEEFINISVGQGKNFTIDGEMYNLYLNGLSVTTKTQAHISVDGEAKMFSQGQTKNYYFFKGNISVYVKTISREDDAHGSILVFVNKYEATPTEIPEELESQSQSLCLGSSCKLFDGETISTTFNGQSLEFEISDISSFSVLLEVNGQGMLPLQVKQANTFSGITLEIEEISSDYVIFTLSSGACSGCLLNNKCYNVGYRTSKRYCGEDGNFFDLKIEGQTCSNSFECQSQICIDTCIDKGQWEKFMDWFRKLFSGGSEEKEEKQGSGAEKPQPPISVGAVPLTEKEKTIVTNTIMSSVLATDMPEKYPISLQFFYFEGDQRIWQDTFIIGKGGVLKTGIPTIRLTLHSNYIQKMATDDLCSVIQKAKENGDLGFYSDYSKANLFWKYKGMLRHRGCFGF